MTIQIFRLHSTIALPLEDVHQFFDETDLPAEIADVRIRSQNNTLHITSIPAEDNISQYTATAQLKASCRERRVYETDDGEWSSTPPDPPNNQGPQWGSIGSRQAQEDEKITSQGIEYASFQGDREDVLQNTALQYPMFEVLCGLARYAEKGSLVAITADGDHLKVTHIVDGEERPATIEIVEEASEGDSEKDAGWRNNPFINSE